MTEFVHNQKERAVTVGVISTSTDPRN